MENDGSLTFTCTYTVEGNVGDVYEDNGREVHTSDGGLQGCTHITVYPEGFPVAKLPETVANWTQMNPNFNYNQSELVYPIISYTEGERSVAYLHYRDYSVH